MNSWVGGGHGGILFCPACIISRTGEPLKPLLQLHFFSFFFCPSILLFPSFYLLRSSSSPLLLIFMNHISLSQCLTFVVVMISPPWHPDNDSLILFIFFLFLLFYNGNVMVDDLTSFLLGWFSHCPICSFSVPNDFSLLHGSDMVVISKNDETIKIW